MIGWEDYTLMISLMSKGFPLQRPDWRVVYCNGSLYVFLTRNIVNFLINFTFLTATYFSRAGYNLFVLKVPLNPNQPAIPPLVGTVSIGNGFRPPLAKKRQVLHIALKELAVNLSRLSSRVFSN